MLILVLAAVAAQTPAAQAVAVVDQAFSGPATEIAVLGTPHLAELDKRFTRAGLDPLLTRLAAWKPGVMLR